MMVTFILQRQILEEVDKMKAQGSTCIGLGLDTGLKVPNAWIFT